MSKFEDNNLLVTRNTLLNEINELSYEEFNYIHEDNWSIAQICHHLVLSEETFAEAIKYGLNKNNEKNVEAKNIQYILDRTKKVNAPEMVMPSNEPFETRQIIELLAKSRDYLGLVVDSIENKSILYERSVKHPVFGYLPLFQWIELVYLHEQRHIEQIKELKFKINC